MLRVENTSLYRDENSKAIINRDSAAYRNRIRTRQIMKKQTEAEAAIQYLLKEIEVLKKTNENIS